MFNGDWTEQSLLEKPNGLSFGALYGLDSKANSVFSEIEREYNATLALKKRHENNSSQRAMFQDQWYVPQGESWALYF
jgi:iron complex transport system substrate-binding protein